MLKGSKQYLFVSIYLPRRDILFSSASKSNNTEVAPLKFRTAITNTLIYEGNEINHTG